MILEEVSSASCQKERQHKISVEAQMLPRAELLSSIYINEADLGILVLYHGCSFTQQYISLAKSRRARNPVVDLPMLSTSQSPQCSASKVSNSFIRQINIQTVSINVSQLSEQFSGLSILSPSLREISLLNE